MNNMTRFKKTFVRAYNSVIETVKSLLLYAYVIWMVKSENVRSSLEDRINEINENMRN